MSRNSNNNKKNKSGSDTNSASSNGAPPVVNFSDARAINPTDLQPPAGDVSHFWVITEGDVVGILHNARQVARLCLVSHSAITLQRFDSWRDAKLHYTCKYFLGQVRLMPEVPGKSKNPIHVPSNYPSPIRPASSKAPSNPRLTSQQRETEQRSEERKSSVSLNRTPTAASSVSTASRRARVVVTDASDIDSDLPEDTYVIRLGHVGPRRRANTLATPKKSTDGPISVTSGKKRDCYAISSAEARTGTLAKNATGHGSENIANLPILASSDPSKMATLQNDKVGALPNLISSPATPLSLSRASSKTPAPKPRNCRSRVLEALDELSTLDLSISASPKAVQPTEPKGQYGKNQTETLTCPAPANAPSPFGKNQKQALTCPAPANAPSPFLRSPTDPFSTMPIQSLPPPPSEMTTAPFIPIPTPGFRIRTIYSPLYEDDQCTWSEEEIEPMDPHATPSTRSKKRRAQDRPDAATGSRGNGKRRATSKSKEDKATLDKGKQKAPPSCDEDKNLDAPAQTLTCTAPPPNELLPFNPLSSHAATSYALSHPNSTIIPDYTFASYINTAPFAPPTYTYASHETSVSMTVGSSSRRADPSVPQPESSVIEINDTDDELDEALAELDRLDRELFAEYDALEDQDMECIE